MTVSVRFAPSPTGFMHIGNLRTALFNALFAIKNGGSFLLRIDDTDVTRSTKECEQQIYEDLKWFGIKWDRLEKQSDRFDRYNEELDRLKKIGRIYPCFETEAELELKRKVQLGRGLPPVYDRAALKLSEADIAKLIADGKKPAWRFKLNDADVEWDDLIAGPKKFPMSSLSDPIVVRSDGTMLYSFCSIVDDVEFGITHIIRGADHITNTAPQIQMWEAVTDKPVPLFAHFPLMVSADGREMSKRLGSFSIRDMRGKDGLEAMAICSLVAKTGTSDSVVPCLSLEELAETFDLSHVSRASSVKFDERDLKTLTAKILHMLPYETAKPRLEALGLGAIDEAFWLVARANIERFDDVQHWWRVVQGPVTPKIDDQELMKVYAENLPGAPWDMTTWNLWAKAVQAKTGRSGKELFMPLRLALTGEEHGPDMKHLLPLIGPEKTKARLAGKQA